MKVYIILTLVALIASKFWNEYVITREHLDILEKNANFKIYKYDNHPFKDYSIDDLKNKLGIKGLDHTKSITLPLGNVSNLPENFDSRNEWSNCIHSIRDQKNCGSCWAFAASEVLSDRLCIASKGVLNVVLSPQNFVSCDSNNMGCNGGYSDRSWYYLISDGIVTDDCYPYVSGSGDTGICQINNQLCVNKNVPYIKYKAANVRTFNSIEEIKNDIFTNGPVETTFQIYQDFFSYSGGIYKRTSDVYIGGHAVKVVGWGRDQETNTDYWIAANSWGPNSGELGYFRFAIGNCCNFETGMMSGIPLI